MSAGWPEDFAWDAGAISVLNDIDLAFGNCERPVYFTDVNHCCECREHHEELSEHPTMELRRSNLGSAAWDPICFTSAQGKAHLFPILARYSMAPSFWPEYDWYGTQLVFHLTSGGQYNEFWQSCDAEQRLAVVRMIEWIIEHRKDEIDLYLDDHDWLAAWQLWAG
jgi:hypothetical protein